MDEAYEHGFGAGVNQAAWTVDTNTPLDRARALLVGHADGDPAVMDLCPSPLSGEWAAEAISEVLGDEFTDDDADEYEAGFTDGFWTEVTRVARLVTAEEAA